MSTKIRIRKRELTNKLKINIALQANNDDAAS